MFSVNSHCLVASRNLSKFFSCSSWCIIFKLIFLYCIMELICCWTQETPFVTLNEMGQTHYIEVSPCIPLAHSLQKETQTWLIRLVKTNFNSVWLSFEGFLCVLLISNHFQIVKMLSLFSRRKPCITIMQIWNNFCIFKSCFLDF